MEPWITPVLTIITGIFASTGFWAYLQTRKNVKTSTDKLIMGLAYDKITHLGMYYIERGWISKDEYEDFRKYLYEPYKDLGGNGVAERIMQEVARLPLLSQSKVDQLIDTAKNERASHREGDRNNGRTR